MAGSARRLARSTAAEDIAGVLVGLVQGCRLPVVGAAALASLFAASGPAQAQSTAPDMSTSRLGAYGFRGTATYRNYSYFQESPNDDRSFYNEGILDVEWARRLATWVSLKLVGEVRGDTARFAQGVRYRIPDEDLHRDIVGLKEAVATFRRGSFELSLGKQFYAWGTADSFNPTDQLNPHDYLDPIDSEKMGVYSVAAHVGVRVAQLTFVVVPFFTPSRLPLADSRWAPMALAGSASANIDDRDLPDRDFGSMQYGAHLKTKFKGWDLSASYYEGFESTPVLKLSQGAVLPGVAVTRATPVLTRLRAAGFDFSTAWRKFEFHGEGAFKFVVYDGRHDRFQIVAGLNYNLDDFRLPWLERITFIAEYGKEVNLSTARGSAVLGTESLVRFGLALPDNAFRNAAAGRVAFNLSEDTELTLSGILDFTTSFSHYVQIKLTHKLVDALHMGARLDFFTGDRGRSFWGQWRDNDRFSFSLKYFL